MTLIRRYSTNLRRAQGQAARVERAAERDLHHTSAHLKHGRLVAGERKRHCEAFRRSIRVNDDIGFGPRLLRNGTPAAKRRCDTPAGGLDVDQLDFGVR